jgi:hypothetical protein
MLLSPEDVLAIIFLVAVVLIMGGGPDDGPTGTL